MEVKILFWVLEFCDYIPSDIVMSPRLENSPISFITQEVPWRLANSKKKTEDIALKGPWNVVLVVMKKKDMGSIFPRNMT